MKFLKALGGRMKFLKALKIKHWIYLGVFVVLVIVLTTSLLSVRGGRDTVRVYVLEGVISETDKYGIVPLDVQKKLDNSGHLGAVVLRINSPGGSVVASQEILDSIKRFREDTNVPVVVSMGELAASGGYYIALGGDRIIANAGTLTGSIGVISQFLYIEGLYEKLGIETEIVKSGEYKDIGNQLLTDDERAIIQVLSDNVYEQFVREVAEARGMSLDDVRKLATGEVYSGEQALALGLIDELGTLNDAIDVAAKLANIEEPKISIKKSGGGAFGGLLGMIEQFSDIRYGLSVRW